MELGKKIYELRKKAGLSQMQLAEKLNVTRQTISNWELEQTKPDIAQAKEIANVFDVSLDELVDNDVKDVLVKKVINTEKMTNKIMNLLKCIIIVIVGWTAIMVVAICIRNNQIKKEEIRIAQEQANFQKDIQSLKKIDYIGKIDGNEFRITPYYDENNFVDNILLASIKTSENQDVFNKEWSELINYIDNNFRDENSHRPLNEFIKETKAYFESKGGSFELEN